MLTFHLLYPYLCYYISSPPYWDTQMRSWNMVHCFSFCTSIFGNNVCSSMEELQLQYDVAMPWNIMQSLRRVI